MNSRRGKMRPIKACKNCGKVFSMELHRLNVTSNCSYSCKQATCGKLGGAVRAAALRKGDKCVSYQKDHGRHAHRVAAEKRLGRPLKSSEVVHHWDEDIHNNDPDNLLVLTQKEHIALHREKITKARRIQAAKKAARG